MKIFLNDNIRSYTKGRGVTRCFWHIADGLIRHWQEQVTIFSPSDRDYGRARHIRSLQMDFRGSHRLRLHALTDKWAAWASNRERASVFLSPYYGNAHPKAPELFVVHDMIHALPQYRTNEDPMAVRFRMEVRRCLERAAALLAVSENTANDIVKCYPHIRREKIFTVRHGVDAFFSQADDGRPASQNNKPYFLFVGHRGGYKNFLRLLTAFGQSGLAGKFDLLAISPVEKNFSPAESELIRKYDLHQAVRIIGAATESDLRASYAAAAAFVYPSEYEGFGLPILEAMASGTLVATANTSSMPEVGGPDALYFDPLDVDSISDCLRRIASMPAAELADFKKRGWARAQAFTWERSVGEAVQVINRF